MNKGLKKHTKQIIKNVGPVQISVNPSKKDNNLHIIIPLITTVGKCPISTSLIFDYKSRSDSYQFGKGVRLNYFSRITSLPNYKRITNFDGSADNYYPENNYFNAETGLTLSIVTDSEDEAQKYALSDKIGNTTYIDMGFSTTIPEKNMLTNVGNVPVTSSESPLYTTSYI